MTYDMVKKWMAGAELAIKIKRYLYRVGFKSNGVVILIPEKGECAYSNYDKSQSRYVRGWPVFKAAVDAACEIERKSKRLQKLGYGITNFVTKSNANASFSENYSTLQGE